MIESKEALFDNFMRLATQFQQAQDPITGIDLDDAIVKLRRYLLSREQNETLAGQLYDLGKLVRKRDMDAYGELLEGIRAALSS
jgi:hypothetical protein